MSLRILLQDIHWNRETEKKLTYCFVSAALVNLFRMTSSRSIHDEKNSVRTAVAT